MLLAVSSMLVIGLLLLVIMSVLLGLVLALVVIEDRVRRLVERLDGSCIAF